MRKSDFSKSHLFLLEFIFVVLFFSLCVAICVMVFVKSETLSRESSELNQGILLAQSTAECIKAHDVEDLDAALASFVGMSAETKAGESVETMALYRGYYDITFAPSEIETAVFSMEAAVNCHEEILSALVTVTKGERQVCQIEVKKYVQGKVGAADGQE